MQSKHRYTRKRWCEAREDTRVHTWDTSAALTFWQTTRLRIPNRPKTIRSFWNSIRSSVLNPPIPIRCAARARDRFDSKGRPFESNLSRARKHKVIKLTVRAVCSEAGWSTPKIKEVFLCLAHYAKTIHWLIVQYFQTIHIFWNGDISLAGNATQWKAE